MRPWMKGMAMAAATWLVKRMWARYQTRARQRRSL